MILKSPTPCDGDPNSNTGVYADAFSRLRPVAASTVGAHAVAAFFSNHEVSDNPRTEECSSSSSVVSSVGNLRSPRNVLASGGEGTNDDLPDEI